MIFNEGLSTLPGEMVGVNMDLRWRLAVLLFGVAALGGCAGPPPEMHFSSDRNPQIYPSNYRTDTLSFMRTYLNNPSQVREAAISEPVLRTLGGRERYVACLRYNARDSANRYTGTSDRLAVFFEGRFDQLVEKAAELCSGATFAPFPELERLGTTPASSARER